MRRLPRHLQEEGLILVGALGAALLAATAHAADPARGEVLAGVAGCPACHTVDGGAPMAGGYAIETKWGTFYGSNLTPDPEHGLGAWDLADFERAMRKGSSPAHRPYYPAFPYPAFTGMTDADLADLWAWMRTLPPVASAPPEHEIRGVYGWRFLLRFWKVTGLQRGPIDDGDRGAYLARAVAHCGECHTPRGGLGMPKEKRALAGTSGPPPAPNLTPSADGIGGWSEAEIASYLGDGEAPDGDVAAGEMRRLIRDGTSRLSAADRAAIAAWVRAHAPLDDRGRAAALVEPSARDRDADEEDW